MAKKKQRKLSYWEKRAVDQEEYVFRGLASKETKITNAYLKAQEYLTGEVKKIYNRYLKKSDLSEGDVKKTLNSTVAPADLIELQRLAKSIEDKGVKAQAQTHLNGMAVKSRITRLEDLKAKSFLVSKQVADVQLQTSTDYFIDVIKDGYEQAAAEGIIGKNDQVIKDGFEIHNWQNGSQKIDGNSSVPNYAIKNNKPVVEIYDWQKQKVVKTIDLTPDVPVQEFKQLSTKYVNNILDSHWQESNYSERIWQDTERLAKRLEELFTVEAMTGMSEREMANAIAEEFQTSINIARRLIRTEANYMANQAKLKGWKKHGVEKYVIVAVLDLRTSKICQEKDGKIYDVEKAVCNGKDGNYPPFHPWCRTVVRAYFGKASLQGNRTANDPITGERFKILQSDTYKQWEDMLIAKHGIEEVGQFKKKVLNHKRDMAQYKQFKTLLGEKNIPKFFEEFQDLKYNDHNKWQLFLDYKNSRQSNMISAFNSFDDYFNHKQFIEAKMIGVTASDGTVIKSQSKHFIERVFGTTSDPKTGLPRSGVSIETILETIKSGETVASKRDATVIELHGSGARVTLNKKTGNLIQVNPLSSRRRREK